MFNKEKYLKEIEDKYQLDNQDVKKILGFFIGQDYKIKIPNSFSEMKINNRQVINLELPSNMLSAHIIESENPNDSTVQLNIYENNQNAEVLSEIICFKAIDDGDLRGCSDGWFSNLRMETVSYFGDGSVVYSYIFASRCMSSPLLYITTNYYNPATCKFIGDEIENIGIFSGKLKAYNIYPDLALKYEEAGSSSKEDWIDIALNEYYDRLYRIIDEDKKNSKLTLGGE